jgi:predicted RNA-binding Zn-ribbon protein involved in translation (DUF1610 family)
MKVQICPYCKSKNIGLYMGGQTGIQYECKACGYVGPIVIEQDIEMK